jgi:hypothetical protein
MPVISATWKVEAEGSGVQGLAWGKDTGSNLSQKQTKFPSGTTIKI